MKIRLLSDLHLEGNKYYYDYKGEDVVVLAGDIHTQGRHAWLLDQIPSNVEVIMVAGNHEYYGAVYEFVNSAITDLEQTYPNFHFLQNESLMIGDVDFFGGTMFTDFNLYGHADRSAAFARNGIADFSWISCMNEIPEDFDMSYYHPLERLWTTDDHVAEHRRFSRELYKWIEDTAPGKRVVISHFVPHVECSDPKFANSPLNPYFITDMRKYFEGINLWLFGHTHASCDKVIDGCRLVCNPHGYGSENKSGFNNDLIVEI